MGDNIGKPYILLEVIAKIDKEFLQLISKNNKS